MVEETLTPLSSFSPIFYISIIVLILIIGLIIFLIKKGRGNFKPNLWKVIVSIIVVIIWIFLMSQVRYNIMCGICVPHVCEADYYNWMIVKDPCGGHGCSCTPFMEMLSSNLQHILIPFALVYVIWSLFQKR